MIIQKKICGAALALGGLLSLIGAVASLVNSISIKMLYDDAFNATIGTSIFARIAAIIVFVAAIALIVMVFRAPSSKKGAAITGGIFAAIAFVGQFLINLLTNSEALIEILTYSRPVGGAMIGLLMIAAAGIATHIAVLSVLLQRAALSRSDKLDN